MGKMKLNKKNTLEKAQIQKKMKNGQKIMLLLLEHLLDQLDHF